MRSKVTEEFYDKYEVITFKVANRGNDDDPYTEKMIIRREDLQEAKGVVESAIAEWYNMDDKERAAYNYNTIMYVENELDEAGVDFSWANWNTEYSVD